MPSKSDSKDLILLIVYINVVLYATCYQLQRPLEPYLVEKLSVKDSSNEYARLQSFFSVVQTAGSLASGYFLDKVSIKAGFLITFICSGLSYYILSVSTTIDLLYLSKVPTIFQAGFLCAQVTASQLTSDGAERVAVLGRLTTAYTVGMVLGPAVGGWIGASGDYYFGAKMSAVGSIISAVLTVLMPDYEVVKPVSSGETDATNTLNTKNKSTDVISTVVRILSVVWLLLATKIFTGIANSIASTAMPLVLKDTYSFKESDMGFFMSGMAAMNALVNGLLLAPIITLLGGDLTRAVGLCLLSTMIWFGLQALSTYPATLATLNAVSGLNSNGMFFFVATTLITTLIQYVLATTLTGASTGRVADHEKGTLLGLEHSMFAAARVVAPYAGVSLLTSGGISLVAASAASVYGAVLLLWTMFKHNLLQDKLGRNIEQKEK